jgi:dTDP-4-dehydrorhamnose reductase
LIVVFGGNGQLGRALAKQSALRGVEMRGFALTAPTIARNPAVMPTRIERLPTAAKRPANSALQCEKCAPVFGIRLRNWADQLAADIAAAFCASLCDASHVA